MIHGHEHDQEFPIKDVFTPMKKSVPIYDTIHYHVLKWELLLLREM